MKAYVAVKTTNSKTKTEIYDTINEQMVKDLTKKLGIREIIVKRGVNHQIVG